MQKEILRQIVHLSGLLFVFLAQIFDKWISSAIFFGIFFIFIFYGEYIKIKKQPLLGLRNLAFFFERKNTRPFTGAIFFYLGCGLAFLIFPHNIASVSSAILAVGDSLSTIIGMNFGRHKTIGKKSVEGSLAFFAGSFLISLIFVKWQIGFIGSLIAALVELCIPPKIGGKTLWLLDDNLLIPIICGIVMFLFGFYF